MQHSIRDTATPAATPDQRLNRLQDENHRLRQELQAFKAEAEHNQAVHQRLRDHELTLFNADSPRQLVEALTRGTAQTFDLDNVTLALADSQQRWRQLFAQNDNQLPPQLFCSVRLSELSAAFKNLQRPQLGPYHAALHRHLFPTEPTPRSVALLPLRRQQTPQLLGVLNLGSTDPQRYSASQGSDFLHHFGRMSTLFLENALTREELRRSSLSDGLTGCYNRRFLQERLLQELAAALRARQPLCLLLFDLDYFKTVNDTYGHLVGDQVLIEFAGRLRRQLRINDVVARYGGEEFAALLPRTQIKDALNLAERVRQKVREPMLLEQTTVNVTVSIGVCEFNPRAPEADHNTLAKRLLNAADEALYQAKTLGRNRIEQAPALSTTLTTDL